MISTSSAEDFFSVVVDWIGFEARHLANVVWFTMYILNNSRKMLYVLPLRDYLFQPMLKGNRENGQNYELWQHPLWAHEETGWGWQVCFTWKMIILSFVFTLVSIEI